MSAALQHPKELRDRILDATLQVIREAGVAGIRTNAIAREAGCAEGSIYRYFSGKPDLLREVVRTRLPRLLDLLESLVETAGAGSLEPNLLAAARAAQTFYAAVVPIYAGALADAKLLARQRELFDDGAVAPPAAVEALVAYLRAEQRAGAVRPGADVELVARLLLFFALGESLSAALSRAETDRRASTLVDVALRELR